MKHQLNPRWVLIAIALLAVMALMSGAALARTGDGARVDLVDNSSANEPAIQIDTKVLNGGHYQLTDILLNQAQDDASPANEIASGGGYHLQVLDSPRLTGTGCCCLYLPCIVR